MKKPTAIQLNIAKPCHEDWDKMSQQEQGRFCGSCRKTVIDFTTWSDRDLYNFFRNYQSGVCGRFFSSQLRKELPIPPQPTSRLYRLAIAAGMTLMFAQIPEAHSRVLQQTELLTYEDGGGDEKNGNAKDKGTLRGKVLDGTKNPIPYAVVEVTVKGIKKMQTVADMNGNYKIENLPAGKYEVSATAGADKATLINIRIAANTQTTRNISIVLGVQPPEPLMMGGAMPEPIMKGDVAPEAIELPPSPPPPPSQKMGKVKAR